MPNGNDFHGRSFSATTSPTTRDFAHNSGRCAHRDILDEAIGAWCAAHDLDHVQKTADAAGIGNSRYNLPSEVLVHPQLDGA